MTGDAGALVELSRTGGELEAEWAALARRRGASPFLHPGYVGAWAEAFGAGPLTLVTARRDGALVAALPLRRDGGRLGSVGDWHIVETGLLAEDDAAAAALARTLFAARARGLTLELLDPASAARLRDAARAAGWRTLEQPMLDSPYLELEGDYEALTASWSSKRRSEHRRLARRLGELGEVRFDSVREPADVDAAFDQLLALEAQGWKAAGGTAIAQRRETERFYRQVARWAAGEGWLRLDALRLDGRPIAMSLGLEAGGVFYGLKLGYDRALRRHGPAVVMIDEQLRRCFEQGLTRYEMLGDSDDYKRQWCTAAAPRVRLRAFAPSLAGRADHAALAYGRPLARRLRHAARSGAARVTARARAGERGAGERGATEPAEPAT